MKLSVLGLCAAGAAAILLQVGTTTGPISSAVAAESCIKANVKLHVKPCGPAKKMHHAKKHASAEPTITPTAAAPASCIKTDVAMHVKRCTA